MKDMTEGGKMRDIKFRQFINGKFHYWGYHGQDSFIGPVTPVIGSQQFTGLHDKNGKEIYEGDILKGNCEVRFCNGCFIALHKDFDDCISSAPKYQLEVIGNIYENPDLVGGTQKEER